jgi:hypothetical protein
METFDDSRITTVETLLKAYRSEVNIQGSEIRDIWTEINFIVDWISENFGTA